MAHNNIFELLDEGAPKKQAKEAPKKEAAAPAKQAAAPAAAAAPAKKEAAPAAAKQEAPQGNNNNQGRGGRGGQGRGRGRGGRGGAGGRGGSSSAAPAAAASSGAAAGEVDNKPRGDSDRTRERRQREDAQRRGDYGAPDQQGHVKRPYDKFSHSAAARNKEGGRDKKGGHGARNWGTKDTTVPEVSHEEKAEEHVEAAPVADAAPAEAAADEKAEEVPPKEPEVPEVDYNMYLERRKKEEEEISKLVDVNIRKVDDADFKDMKPLVKGDEEFFSVKQHKAGKKQAASNGKGGKVAVDDVLNVQAAPPPRDNGRGRGRGGDRGGRGAGGDRRQNNKKGGAPLSLNNDADFPSLGSK